MDKIEEDFQAVLKHLKDLSMKVDNLTKELDEMKRLSGFKKVTAKPASPKKESNIASFGNTLDENSAYLSTTAANALGFIPHNANMAEAGPQAKFFLCTLLAQASRKMIAYYNRELNQIGISAQQMIALGVLIFQQDVTLGKFAQIMKISSPTALQMLKRLKTMGLITDEPHPTDGRLKVFKITDKTHKLIPKIHQKVNKLEDFIESQAGSSNLDRLVIDLSNLLNIDF